MDDVAPKVDRIWYSERLVYRGIRKEDQAFMSSTIDEDPVNCCLATPMILSPPKRKNADDWWTQFKGGPAQLLGVVVCLPPTGGSSSSAASRTNDAAKILPPTPPTITNGDGATRAPSAAAAEEQPTPIGFCSLEYGGYGTSPHSRSATLGITIAKPYQDSGYGTEVVNWILDWGFRHANLHSIHLGAVEYNKRAHRCYEKCGFTMDGRRRQCFWHDRKYWDLYFFSILEDEWDALRRKGH